MQTTTTKQFFIGFMGPAAFQEAALAVLPALEDELNASVDLDKLQVPFRQLYLTVELVGKEEHIAPQTKLEQRELEVRVKVFSGDLPTDKTGFKAVLLEGIAKQLNDMEEVPEAVTSWFCQS